MKYTQYSWNKNSEKKNDICKDIDQLFQTFQRSLPEDFETTLYIFKQINVLSIVCSKNNSHLEWSSGVSYEKFNLKVTHFILRNIKTQIKYQDYLLTKRKLISITPGIKNIIFKSYAGGLFTHEVLGHLLEADSPYFHNDLGKQISHLPINIVDNPLIPYGFGSYQKDCENFSSKKNTLVENGKLKTLLTNTYYAKKLNIINSASARREGTEFKSSPRMSNTVLSYQPKNFTHLRSPLIVEKFGRGRVNKENGEFLLEVLESRQNENIFYQPFMIKSTAKNFLQKLHGVSGIPQFQSSFCKSSSGIIPVSYAQPHLHFKNIRINNETI